jgi:hypothetical protein
MEMDWDLGLGSLLRLLTLDLSYRTLDSVIEPCDKAQEHGSLDSAEQTIQPEKMPYRHTSP